jgi:hypothetical protein
MLIDEDLSHDSSSAETLLLLLSEVLLEGRIMHEWEAFLKGIVR